MGRTNVLQKERAGNAHDGATHTIYLGRVRAGRVDGVVKPLIYFKGDFCDAKPLAAKAPAAKKPAAKAAKRT